MGKNSPNNASGIGRRNNQCGGARFMVGSHGTASRNQNWAQEMLLVSQHKSTMHPAVPLLDIYQDSKSTHPKDTCALLFTVAPFRPAAMEPTWVSSKRNGPKLWTTMTSCLQPEWVQHQLTFQPRWRASSNEPWREGELVFSGKEPPDWFSHTKWSILETGTCRQEWVHSAGCIYVCLLIWICNNNG